MKICKLISSCNNKGFGLDSVNILVNNTVYVYEVDAVTRMKIERIDRINRKPFDMVNVAKKFGVLIEYLYK